MKFLLHKMFTNFRLQVISLHYCALFCLFDFYYKIHFHYKTFSQIRSENIENFLQEIISWSTVYNTANIYDGFPATFIVTQYMNESSEPVCLWMQTYPFLKFPPLVPTICTMLYNFAFSLTAYVGHCIPWTSSSTSSWQTSVSQIQTNIHTW